jgi:hypothetical protein
MQRGEHKIVPTDQLEACLPHYDPQMASHTAEFALLPHLGLNECKYAAGDEAGLRENICVWCEQRLACVSSGIRTIWKRYLL